jgi:hypothetical protein
MKGLLHRIGTMGLGSLNMPLGKERALFFQRSWRSGS